MQDANALIEKAQNFVERSGIGKALAEIAEEVRQYPAWAKRGDANFGFAVADVTGGEESTQEDDIDWCEFTRPDGTRWRNTAAKSRYTTYSGDSSGILSVDHDRQRVLALRCMRVITRHANFWQPGPVEALRTGDACWAQGLVGIAAEIKARRETLLAQMAAHQELDRASKIEM